MVAFDPLPLLSGPHAQTIIASQISLALAPPSVTRLIRLADGDQLALEVSTPAGWRPPAPTVVLIHGLCGCHGSPYMIRMARKPGPLRLGKFHTTPVVISCVVLF